MYCAPMQPSKLGAAPHILTTEGKYILPHSKKVMLLIDIHCVRDFKECCLYIKSTNLLFLDIHFHTSIISMASDMMVYRTAIFQMHIKALPH